MHTCTVRLPDNTKNRTMWDSFCLPTWCEFDKEYTAGLVASCITECVGDHGHIISERAPWHMGLGYARCLPRVVGSSGFIPGGNVGTRGDIDYSGAATDDRRNVICNEINRTGYNSRNCGFESNPRTPLKFLS